VLPLLHPVRLCRFAFYGSRHGYPGIGLLIWDVVYTLGLSALLLRYARRWARKRLTG
jgi:hypothetical protein